MIKLKNKKEKKRIKREDLIGAFAFCFPEHIQRLCPVNLMRAKIDYFITSQSNPANRRPHLRHPPPPLLNCFSPTQQTFLLCLFTN